MSPSLPQLDPSFGSIVEEYTYFPIFLKDKEVGAGAAKAIILNLKDDEKSYVSMSPTWTLLPEAGLSDKLGDGFKKGVILDYKTDFETGKVDKGLFPEGFETTRKARDLKIDQPTCMI